MGGKSSAYREALRALPAADWDAYLLRESGLPGPRANLELLQAVADLGDEATFRRWRAIDSAQTPPTTALEYLPACAAVGFGRLVAEGRRDLLPELRRHASDSRWRVREGVAMGLQRLGATDMPALLEEMGRWTDGSWLERRTVVAAICEPPILKNPAHARRVLELMDAITQAVAAADASDRRADDFRVLRQALAYGWSVAVVARPEDGKPLFERWLASPDRDVQWILRENLKKNRLKRMDAAWVARVSALRGS